MALRERKLGKFMILKILTGTTNNKLGCERRRDMITDFQKFPIFIQVSVKRTLVYLQLSMPGLPGRL